MDPAYLTDRILTNSVTWTVGEAVRSYTTGFAVKAAASEPILGIIVGFKNNDGSLIAPSANTKSTTAYTTSIESVTSASDNETVAKVKAVICCDVSSRWSAACNGTIGTTTASNLPGGKIDVDSSNTDYGRVLESTNTRTPGTDANFYNWGTDPSDSTRLIVSIAESELFSESS